MKEVKSGVWFRGGSLEDCDLSGAIIPGAHFEGVSMFGAILDNSNLDGCEFYLVLAMGASFKNSSMQGVKFLGGNFEDVCFAKADLTGATFLSDNMGGAVDFSGADFTDVIMEGVTFGSVIYSEKTKFPDNFLPDLAGFHLKN